MSRDMTVPPSKILSTIDLGVQHQEGVRHVPAWKRHQPTRKSQRQQESVGAHLAVEFFFPPSRRGRAAAGGPVQRTPVCRCRRDYCWVRGCVCPEAKPVPIGCSPLGPHQHAALGPHLFLNATNPTLTGPPFLARPASLAPGLAGHGCRVWPEGSKGHRVRRLHWQTLANGQERERQRQTQSQREQAAAASPEEKVPSNPFRAISGAYHRSNWRCIRILQTEFDPGRVHCTTWRTRLIYLPPGEQASWGPPRARKIGGRLGRAAPAVGFPVSESPCRAARA